MRTNNSHERRKKDEKLQDGEETVCKKEYRDDSGQVGNLEGSGEYLSEIDILSHIFAGTVEHGDQVKSIV